MLNGQRGSGHVDVEHRAYSDDLIRQRVHDCRRLVGSCVDRELRFVVPTPPVPDQELRGYGS
jgi:hypothetical protein